MIMVIIIPQSNHRKREGWDSTSFFDCHLEGFEWLKNGKSTHKCGFFYITFLNFGSNIWPNLIILGIPLFLICFVWETPNYHFLTQSKNLSNQSRVTQNYFCKCFSLDVFLINLM